MRSSDRLCFSGGIDLSVSDFVLRPTYTKRLTGGMNFDATFTYFIRRQGGQSPSQIMYKFYMSPDGDPNNPDNRELLGTEETITSPAEDSATAVDGMIWNL